MIFMQFKRHFVYLIVYTVAYSVYLPPTGRSRSVKNIACSAELLPRAPVSVLRGHDYKLTKRDCHSHARLSFFSFRVVTPWNNLPSDVVSAPSLNTFKEDWTNTGDITVIHWIRVCLYEDKWTADRSLWPNIKGWRRRFQGFSWPRRQPVIPMPFVHKLYQSRIGPMILTAWYICTALLHSIGRPIIVLYTVRQKIAPLFVLQ